MVTLSWRLLYELTVVALYTFITKHYKEHTSTSHRLDTRSLRAFWFGQGFWRQRVIYCFLNFIKSTSICWLLAKYIQQIAIRTAIRFHLGEFGLLMRLAFLLEQIRIGSRHKGANSISQERAKGWGRGEEGGKHAEYTQVALGGAKDEISLIELP